MTVERLEERLDKAKDKAKHTRSRKKWWTKALARVKKWIAQLKAKIRRKEKDQHLQQAVQVPLPSAGPMTGGGHKICWHTSEGSTAEGCIAAVRAANAAPHFTFEPKTGRLFQHLPLNQAARALVHIGLPTNTANVIQVELVGFANETGNWSDTEYKRIAALARWIEDKANVPRKCGVSFKTPKRLGEQEFVDYAGHLGHVHVPHNTHYDPGTGFKIGKVI